MSHTLRSSLTMQRSIHCLRPRGIGSVKPGKSSRLTHQMQTLLVGEERCFSAVASTRRRGKRTAKGRGRRSPGARTPASYAYNDSHNDGNKIMFQSLGCPRNFVDTEVMLGVVLNAGMEPTQEMADADYLVVNTCGFLQSARDESSQAVRDMLQQKKDDAKLLVTGCMVNLHSDQILKDFPQVDHVLGAGSVDKILVAIQDIQRKEKAAQAEAKVRVQVERKQKEEQQGEDDEEGRRLQQISLDDENDVVIEQISNVIDCSTDIPSLSAARSSFLEQGDTPRFLATPSHFSYLKIAEGCRKRCSFCIIPKIKGRLQSKPIDQVVQEFKSLLDTGSKEIILIAQDLGDYGKDRRKELAAYRSTLAAPEAAESVGVRRSIRDQHDGLALLLRALLDNDDRDFWLRLLYLYPDEINSDVIDIIENDRRVVRYLDMPIQHINDTMLKAMKRTTTGDAIKSTIRELRRRLPDIHIRTSLMVGFPGETEEQFQELLDFVRQYKLDNVGAFMYSDEELAWSSKLPNHVPQEVKAERYDRLMQAQLEIVRQQNSERIERRQRLEVVVEGFHAEHDDLIVGRYYGQCPDIDGQVIINDVDELGKLPVPGERYWVELTDFDDYDLIGRIVVPRGHEYEQDDGSAQAV